MIAHTVSSIVCCHIEGENRRQIPPDIEIISNYTTHPFHGTNTIVEELEIAVSFTELETSDFQKYKITVCNHDGNSTCIVELRLMTTGKHKQICCNLSRWIWVAISVVIRRFATPFCRNQFNCIVVVPFKKIKCFDHNLHAILFYFYSKPLLLVGSPSTMKE